jgi:late competence protein required for DNA uptake (superfamily II DNA/RNA helicase)
MMSPLIMMNLRIFLAQVIKTEAREEKDPLPLPKNFLNNAYEIKLHPKKIGVILKSYPE